MKARVFYTMIIIGVMLLSGLVFSQQQTITYENFPKGRMVLIGIPLNFDDNDPGAVLGPVFGAAGNDWRFSRWNVGAHTYFRYGETEYTWDHNAQTYTSEKTEQGDPPDIEPGIGYWLARNLNSTVDDLSLTGTPVNQNAPVYVTIDAPETVRGHTYAGLTMVANPFLYPIDWADAYYRINGETEVTLEQAVNMGLVSQYAYPWDGDQYTPYNMNDGGDLAVWDGYWVEQLNHEETGYIVYDVACEIEGSGNGGDDCGTCPDEEIGQMKWLRLRYNGDYSTARITVYDSRWNLLFNDEVQSGGEFEFYGVRNKQSMGCKIYLYVENTDDKCGCESFDCEIHTSCSVEIGPGQVWGSFTIMGAISKNGITLCPVGETNKPIVKFYNASANGSEDNLGEGGVIETDRFQISLTDDDNDELSFKTYTVDGDSSEWTSLTQEGIAVSDGLGFTVTLISEDEDEYIIDVASAGSQSAALEAVKFRFGDDQTLDSPGCGETFTATRRLLGGEQVSILELKIPPVDAGAKFAKASAKPSQPLKAESVSEWIIPLSISSSDGAMVDDYNGFGVKESASAMFDLLDARNFTPNLDAWVDIYFPHHLQSDPLNYWPQNPMKAAYDVRPPADVISWNVNVAYYQLGNQNLTISWDANQLPDDMELTLVDFGADKRIDMLAVQDYVIKTPADSYGILYFAVVAAEPEETVSIDRDNTTPAEYRLLGNYPNPFNATTQLQYNLPEAAKVTLTIYDLNGKLVNTLVNGFQPAGYHGINWNGCDQNGTPVSTGIYLYQLQADGRAATRKMILMK